MHVACASNEFIRFSLKFSEKQWVLCTRHHTADTRTRIHEYIGGTRLSHYARAVFPSARTSCTRLEITKHHTKFAYTPPNFHAVNYPPDTHTHTPSRTRKNIFEHWKYVHDSPVRIVYCTHLSSIFYSCCYYLQIRYASRSLECSNGKTTPYGISRYLAPKFYVFQYVFFDASAFRLGSQNKTHTFWNNKWLE